MSKLAQRDSFVPPLWILTLLGAILLFWLLSELREIVVLLVVGYAIAYIFDPILDWLETKKISRSVGVFVIIGVVLIFILLMFLTAVPTVIDQYERLSKNLPSYVTKAREELIPLYEKVKSQFPNVPEGNESPLNMLPNIDTQTLNSILAGIFGALLKGYSITLTLINLVLLPFIVFYIAIDLEKIHRSILGIFPGKVRRKVEKYFGEINTYVSAFVRGQLSVCFILFCLYALGLGIVGIDLWFLLAVIAGFGNMIPYVGFLSGIILSTIMSLATFGDFAHVFQVWIVFGVVQLLEGFVITPKIIGSSVGLSPLMIILAIFAGGQLFGLLGVFLAIPGAAILRVSAKHLHQWVLSKSQG